MDKIFEVLKEVGFEDREIKIYLTLINSGDLTALMISKNTHIDRTTTYDILEKLIFKGVVSSYTKNNTKQFHALTPDKLLLYFREKYSSLEMIIPMLKKSSNQTKNVVTCELFQGKEGLRSVLKDLIDTAKSYRVISIRKEYETILGFFHEQGVLKLNEFNAKECAIVEKDSKFKKLKNGEYRYLNKKLISPITTLIYENKVIFFIWNEPYFAIQIENESLAKAQNEYFELMWNIAKR